MKFFVQSIVGQKKLFAMEERIIMVVPMETFVSQVKEVNEIVEIWSKLLYNKELALSIMSLSIFAASRD